MEQDKLLNLGTELGRRLMVCGAEIYRVEESVNRLLTAYGLIPQVFAIPCCLFSNILSAYLRNDNNPMLATKAVVIGGVFNAVLPHGFVKFCVHGKVHRIPPEKADTILSQFLEIGKRRRRSFFDFS